ncbi:GTPase ObgE [Candidatus Peregrinibacteria bacterium]|nr:MAG: GTPase ObgE [Candidatus Peregrinibacteria bacterium]
MRFCDETTIWVKAGDGGNGGLSYRREKYIPKGGPDGGNGGQGGNIIFAADENINTLSEYVGHHHHKAKRGDPGMDKNKFGADGEDLILTVPVGTLIYDDDTGELIADLTEMNQQVLAARGGRGGKGNAGFKTSIRKTPDFAELGEPGQERNIRLELKLIADVALVGYPSVGKSTLISRISNSRPKIADYPFTTLVPNLGVVKVDDVDFVVADIPGLIEGAHAGKGLGDEFLKHIERTKLIVHLIDITHEKLKEEYQQINKELELFSAELAKKPQILVFNKIDASIPELNDQVKKEFKKWQPLFISSVSGEGLSTLLYAIKEALVALRKKESQGKETEKVVPKVFRPHLDDKENIRQFEVTKLKEGEFQITGKRIEQLSIMTDMSKKGAIYRMYDILEKIGAMRELKKQGIELGNKIQIGVNTFEYLD